MPRPRLYANRVDDVVRGVVGLWLPVVVACLMRGRAGQAPAAVVPPEPGGAECASQCLRVSSASATCSSRARCVPVACVSWATCTSQTRRYAGRDTQPPTRLQPIRPCSTCSPPFVSGEIDDRDRFTFLLRQRPPQAAGRSQTSSCGCWTGTGELSVGWLDLSAGPTRCCVSRCASNTSNRGCWGIGGPRQG